ncbi:inositol monophosphatase family protein [Heliorestis acidaminivorans]|uniref:Inositol monophosphatase family protein n=1 Tax=Heliorestis acidaminivorans TaxID=553427 RepID=A0A6I0EVE5_9FIRM|nr:inositol monophosphatase family protein [Heliorestis acidaminivorans]KAB2953454.1 inositol monophosphatase family protein [Heliorestis acidaminivorans]
MLDSKIVVFAKEIVRCAGQELKKAIQQEIICTYKENDHRELLTEFDVKIEEYLIHHIKNNYPDHGIISEEKEEKDDLKGYVWIIDPIDGTTNFINFQNNFAISVALYYNSQPCLGIVYDVMKDHIYWAISGRGSFVNDCRIPPRKPPLLRNAIADISLNSIESFYYKEHIKLFDLAKEIRGHRCSGSASLSICQIALGNIDIYISAKLKSWDFSAATIVLTEVGGYYGNPFAEKVDLTGTPITFMASSSQAIYQQVCERYFCLPKVAVT